MFIVPKPLRCPVDDWLCSYFIKGKAISLGQTARREHLSLLFRTYDQLSICWECLPDRPGRPKHVVGSSEEHLAKGYIQNLYCVLQPCYTRPLRFIPRAQINFKRWILSVVGNVSGGHKVINQNLRVKYYRTVSKNPIQRKHDSEKMTVPAEKKRFFLTIYELLWTTKLTVVLHDFWLTKLFKKFKWSSTTPWSCQSVRWPSAALTPILTSIAPVQPTHKQKIHLKPHIHTTTSNAAQRGREIQWEREMI